MEARSRRALIAGESWIMHTIHQKGVDSFNTTAYGTGHQWLQGALETGGWEVEHLPNHLAPAAFPTTMAELDGYDVAILSDIGSNSLLLSPDTFERSISAPNRLVLLRDWVAAGQVPGSPAARGCCAALTIGAIPSGSSTRSSKG